MKWTELRVIQMLMPWAMQRGHIVLPNVYFFNWEADMLSVTTVGKIVEYEIKVSRQDFKADKHKKKKHNALSSRLFNSRKGIPNYFNYVSPPGIIDKDEVPDYAGLIHVTRKGQVIEVKRPPQLHRQTINSKQVRSLLKAFMWRVWLKLYAPVGWKPPSKIKKRRDRSRKQK